MSVFLLNSATNTTLFFKNSCYSYRYHNKLLFLNAFFIYKKLKLFSLTSKKRTFMISLDINSKLTPIYIKLLGNSLKLAPDMPISYHLETLRIAARLLGGK